MARATRTARTDTETDIAQPTAATPTMPIGVISLGSNDLHLLVARSDGADSFTEILNQAALMELEVTLTEAGGGALPVSALCQALGHLDALTTAARAAGAGAVFALATEVMREARNGQAFLALAAATLNIETILLTGAEEAALDYRWARFSLHPAAQADAADLTLPMLGIDSGGGSTQVLVGAGAKPTFSTSLPIGAGSLTSACIHHDPPRPREMREVNERIAAALQQLPPRANRTPPGSATLMGGSADHLARFAHHPRRLRISRDEREHALAVLQRKSAAEIADRYAVPIERAKLLPAGVSILNATLAHFGVDEAQIKPNGIRGGFVVSYARDGARWRDRL